MLDAALEVVSADSLDYLANENTQAPFDVVFVDPHFSSASHQNLQPT